MIRISLSQEEHEFLCQFVKTGIKKDGVKYTVRDSRKRYFFPDEWKKFILTIKNKKHRLYFLTLLNTGARAMEALNLKKTNFDLIRGTITFDVVKHKAAKKDIMQ